MTSCEHLEDPIEGRVVGVVPALMEAAGLTDEVTSTPWTSAARALADQGAEIVEVDLPNLASAIAAYYVIAPCEAFSNLARFDGVRYGYQEQGCATLAEQTSLSRAHGFGEEAKRRQMLGAYLLSSGTYDKYYYPAQQVRTLITAGLRPRLRELRRHPHAGVPAHGLQVRRDERPHADVRVGHVHHLQQHRRQRRRLRAVGPGRADRPCPCPLSSRVRPSRTGRC